MMRIGTLIFIGLMLICACDDGATGIPVDAALDQGLPIPPDAQVVDAAIDAGFQLCELGQSRCVGGTQISECAEDGTWAPVSRWCVRGICIEADGVAGCDVSCLPGSRECEGRLVIECDDKGDSYSRVQECGFNCQDGQCIEACNGVDDTGDGVVDEGFAVGDVCSAGVGACLVEGVFECSPDGADVVCNATEGEPSIETCNTVDDDCDGTADEGFDLQDDRQNCGACGIVCDAPNSVMFCNEGECDFVRCEDGWADCNSDIALDGCETPGACGAADDCDGIDNDLDGRTDEDFVAEGCGVGACAAVSTCENGVMSACVVGEPMPTDATCDGVDDDCDGAVDEAYTPTDCGVGACAATSACVEGVESVCIAGEAVAEACSGEDEDCDGLTDEGFDLLDDRENCGACGVVCDLPNALSFCNQGVCEFVRCDADWADCNASLEPDGCETAGVCGPDLCNGEDDDNDGQIDEDFVPAPCGVGVCTAASRCEDGVALDCVPGAAAPDDASCDGADDDCDGSTDEDYAPVSCGLGFCAAESACRDGEELACAPGPQGPAEQCDGEDSDCDGRVDERPDGSLPGTPCTVGEGLCAADGLVECDVDGAWQCSATPGAPAADDAMCDGLDEDCDGLTDEDFGGGNCGIGACERNAACVGGEVACTPGDPRPLDAVCDGVDDDCDGSMDEDFEESCGAGECARAGICDAGDPQCTPGEPSAEACNGLDDDCDGQPDEGCCGGELCPDHPLAWPGQCNAQGACEYAPAAGDPRAAEIFVPAGDFLMGAAGEPRQTADEGPIHPVRFAKGFFVGKFEVTTERHTACEASGSCSVPDVRDWSGLGWGLNRVENGRGLHPQNGLDRDAARRFCWSIGARLPTEAEWEYAATGAVHQMYPWGDEPADCDRANMDIVDPSTVRPWACDACVGAGCSGTDEVGQRPAGASVHGLLDQSGNVYEWVSDCHHANYDGAPDDGRDWTAGCGATGVLRGGSFADIEHGELRTAARFTFTPDRRYAYTGARCVRDLPSVPCPPGQHDLDGNPRNGCELACLPRNGGIEACNGTDDDCDGAVDEFRSPVTDIAPKGLFPAIAHRGDEFFVIWNQDAFEPLSGQRVARDGRLIDRPITLRVASRSADVTATEGGYVVHANADGEYGPTTLFAVDPTGNRGPGFAQIEDVRRFEGPGHIARIGNRFAIPVTTRDEADSVQHAIAIYDQDGEPVGEPRAFAEGGLASARVVSNGDEILAVARVDGDDELRLQVFDRHGIHRGPLQDAAIAGNYTITPAGPGRYAILYGSLSMRLVTQNGVTENIPIDLKTSTGGLTSKRAHWDGQALRIVVRNGDGALFAARVSLDGEVYAPAQPLFAGDLAESSAEWNFGTAWTGQQLAIVWTEIADGAIRLVRLGGAGLPGRAPREICNGFDDDCDGTVDEGESGFASVLDDASTGTGAPSTRPADGRQVAVSWQSSETSPRTMRFGIFDAYGESPGVPLALNGLGDLDARSNAMARQADGRFGILSPHVDAARNTSQLGLYIVAADGSSGRDAVFIGDGRFEGEGHLVPQNGGGFWGVAVRPNGSLAAIPVDAEGALVGDRILIDGAARAGFAVPDEGGFTVFWEDTNSDQGSFQRYDAAGDAGELREVVRPLPRYAAIAKGDDSYMAVWNRDGLGVLYTRPLDADGRPLGDAVAVHEGGRDPQVIFNGRYHLFFRVGASGRLHWVPLGEDGQPLAAPSAISPANAGSVGQQFSVTWTGYDFAWSWSESNGANRRVWLRRGTLMCPALPADLNDCIGRVDGALCDDGDPATDGETCQDEICVAPAAVGCSVQTCPDGECILDVCVPRVDVHDFELRDGVITLGPEANVEYDPEDPCSELMIFNPPELIEPGDVVVGDGFACEIEAVEQMQGMRFFGGGFWPIIANARDAVIDRVFAFLNRTVRVPIDFSAPQTAGVELRAQRGAAFGRLTVQNGRSRLSGTTTFHIRYDDGLQEIALQLRKTLDTQLGVSAAVGGAFAPETLGARRSLIADHNFGGFTIGPVPVAILGGVDLRAQMEFDGALGLSWSASRIVDLEVNVTWRPDEGWRYERTETPRAGFEPDLNFEGDASAKIKGWFEPFLDLRIGGFAGPSFQLQGGLQAGTRINGDGIQRFLAGCYGLAGALRARMFNIPIAEVQIAQVERCRDLIVVSDNQCDEGACCGRDGEFVAAGVDCLAQAAQEQRCVTNDCGAARESRTADRTCSGAAAACDGPLDWSQWQPIAACSPEQTCGDGACRAAAECEACEPACGGRACGNDGCGGSCGDCQGGRVCDDGDCVCVPDQNRVCRNGDEVWQVDSCGNEQLRESCGGGQRCANGQCGCVEEGETTCLGDDVWTIDSCGNRLRRVTDCGDAGLACRAGICEDLCDDACPACQSCRPAVGVCEDDPNQDGDRCGQNQECRRGDCVEIELPQEVCNGLDDDGNGMIDDLPAGTRGCFRLVLRYIKCDLRSWQAGWETATLAEERGAGGCPPNPANPQAGCGECPVQQGQCTVPPHQGAYQSCWQRAGTQFRTYVEPKPSIGVTRELLHCFNPNDGQNSYTIEDTCLVFGPEWVEGIPRSLGFIATEPPAGAWEENWRRLSVCAGRTTTGSEDNYLSLDCGDDLAIARYGWALGL